MEVDDIQACKVSRIGNNDSSTSTRKASINKKPAGKQLYQFEEVDNKVQAAEHWPPASRIFRVSRASGGKDRHSKVLTAKGARDRRVRLSVGTAIQFYDIQDRLGFDQPSKAVEWLIKAAAEAITELPPLPPIQYPDAGTMVQFRDDTKRGFDLGHELQLHREYQQQLQEQQQQQQHSSNSETSKGSSAQDALSVHRSKIRAKARDRARERASKDNDGCVNHNHANASFTDLLNCVGSLGNATSNFVPKETRDYLPQAPVASMDYFSPVLFNHSVASEHHQQHQEMAMTPYSFMREHMVPTDNGGDYFDAFSPGFNRGSTLQSNSQSQYRYGSNSSGSDQFTAGFDDHRLHSEDVKGKGKN